MTKGEDLVI